MSNEIMVRDESRPLTAVDVRAQVNLIQEVMRSVMIDGTHFGKVPGCGDQKTLLKPGAEKLMATFRLAADPEIEDLSVMDCARYRVKLRLISSSGVYMGAGVGECSSNEEKYKWRKAICKEEFEDTPEDQRREKWSRGNPPYKIKQIKTNPADVANTVLKMAKKRALVDATLTALAASDIFTQDIEDLPEEYLDDDAPVTSSPKRTVEQPKPKSSAAPAPVNDTPIGDGPKRIIAAKLAAANKTEADLLAHFKISAIADIKMSQINEVITWITL